MQVISITDLNSIVNPTRLTILIDSEQQDFQLINRISILVDSLDALRTWHGFSIAAALGSGVEYQQRVVRCFKRGQKRVFEPVSLRINYSPACILSRLTR